MARPKGKESICFVFAIPDSGLIIRPKEYAIIGFNAKNNQKTNFRLPGSFGFDPPSYLIMLEIRAARSSIAIPTVGSKM